MPKTSDGAPSPMGMPYRAPDAPVRARVTLLGSVERRFFMLVLCVLAPFTPLAYIVWRAVLYHVRRDEFMSSVAWLVPMPVLVFIVLVAAFGCFEKEFNDAARKAKG